MKSKFKAQALSLTLTIAGLTAVGGGAFAGDLVEGPRFGNNARYQAAIEAEDVTNDVDDFVQDLLAGEVLSVEVVALRDSTGAIPLIPLLVMIDPDGVERNAGIFSTDDLRTTSLNKFVVDKSGRWSARISGRDDAEGVSTTGRYEVRFKLRTRPQLSFKKQRLGEDVERFRIHPFSAFEGATLDATLTYDASLIPVAIRALSDPSGADVFAPGEFGPVPAVQNAVERRNQVILKGVRLSEGDGTYALRVRVPTANGRYDLKLKVTPPQRPAAKKLGVLSDLEPFLVARSAPIGGDAGDTIELTGRNFSTNNVPSVFFGSSQSEDVSVSPDGTTVTVVVPPRTGLPVVQVRIVNPDGQVACRSTYFAYVPPPSIEDIVDPLTGLPVHSGSAFGGRALRLTGKNILAGQVLRFGSTPASNFVITSDTTATFNLPAVPDGTYPITITDVFTRQDTADFTFFFKTPPSFASPAYSPGAIAPNKPTTLTISGSNFNAADQFVFNGADFPSTFVDPNTVTMQLPGLGLGSYSMSVIDSVGTVVVGPNVDIKLPPSITGVSVIAGSVIGTIDIPLNGGSTLRVDGANFASSDTVTLGGTLVTSFVSRNATNFSFLAPTNLTGGFATLVVVDGAQQTATLANAVRYVGYDSTTTAKLPAGSAADDLGAGRGIVADLDADGRKDDLVIVSSNAEGKPGTQTRLARLFFANNTTNRLEDKSNTNLPAINTDSRSIDKLDATCLAIGDIDKVTGPDIVLAGEGQTPAGNFAEVRVLKNNGSGTFTWDNANAMPSRFQAATFAYYCPYYYGTSKRYTVYGALTPRGDPTAVVIGDLDKDGDGDVLVGFDHYDKRAVTIQPKAVYSYQGIPSLACYQKIPTANYTKYTPAVRFFLNGNTAAKMSDATLTRLPGAGQSTDVKTSQAPALHCRDMVLGDIDRDNDLDVLVAWNDPTTITAYGLNKELYGGGSLLAPRIATQVLLNNGAGVLTTNATATWLPVGTSTEWWQADRIALGDLDNDLDLDLVMVTAKGVDAFTGTETHTKTALRVLRNDLTRFTNVTASAVPAVQSQQGEDWRGGALLLRDVNGDGFLDILVGTTDALKDASNQAARSTRLFTGGANIIFKINKDFLPVVSTDTAEAQDLLIVDDLGGVAANPLLFLTEKTPQISPNGEKMRTLDWKK